MNWIPLLFFRLARGSPFACALAPSSSPFALRPEALAPSRSPFASRPFSACSADSISYSFGILLSIILDMRLYHHAHHRLGARRAQQHAP